ncbi:MAG: hypothetical protein HYT79_04915 [Elusimicrobia bacterium]|nr:hypothetical protein [Elusimicrobiota bacterium]
MLKWALIFLVVIYGGDKAYEWFCSPRYVEFIESHKADSWVPSLCLKSGIYWTFFADWNKALIFFERCSKEDMKKAPERSMCLYYRAWSHDEARHRNEAIDAYGLFLEEFPKHRKTAVARRRLDVLKAGWSAL